jgi:hypothetical protein
VKVTGFYQQELIKHTGMLHYRLYYKTTAKTFLSVCGSIHIQIQIQFQQSTVHFLQSPQYNKMFPELIPIHNKVSRSTMLLYLHMQQNSMLLCNQNQPGVITNSCIRLSGRTHSPSHYTRFLQQTEAKHSAFSCKGAVY